MKRIFPLLALTLCLAASAQNANYEQAARFSTKHLQNLVYSTRIRPNWFRDSDKFWYSWKTADGTRYYIVDPATGEVLAMEGDFISREKAIELGVPVGPAFGKLHNGEEIEINGRIIKPEQVLGPPRKGIKITYSGDTRPCEEMIMFARDSTLLIHESTFIQKEAQNAEEYGHSTSKDAAFVARESNSKKLIITHISTRYGEEYAQVMLKEAQEIFENTELAEDCMEEIVRGKS